MVSRVVALDAGPLGSVANPKRSPKSFACAQWLQRLVAGDSRVVLPEISDYEVRRELLRGRRVHGLRRLDALASLVDYIPITTAVMCQAAVFSARAPQRGKPTADDRGLGRRRHPGCTGRHLGLIRRHRRHDQRRSSFALRSSCALA